MRRPSRLKRLEEGTGPALMWSYWTSKPFSTTPPGTTAPCTLAAATRSLDAPLAMSQIRIHQLGHSLPSAR